MAIYFVDYENVHDEGLKGIAQLKSNDRVVVFYSNNIKNIPFDLHVEISKSSAEVEYIKTNKTAKNYLDFQLASYLGYCIGKGYTNEVYIISKDTGYDSVVDLWKNRGISANRLTGIVATEKTKSRTAQNKTAQNKNQQSKSKKSKTAQNNGSNDKNLVNEEIKDNDSNIKDSKEKTVKSSNSQSYEFPEVYRKKVRQAIKKDEVVASKYGTIYKFIANTASIEEYENNMKSVFGKDKGQVLFEHTLSIYKEIKGIG